MCRHVSLRASWQYTYILHFDPKPFRNNPIWWIYFFNGLLNDHQVSFSDLSALVALKTFQSLCFQEAGPVTSVLEIWYDINASPWMAPLNVEAAHSCYPCSMSKNASFFTVGNPQKSKHFPENLSWSGKSPIFHGEVSVIRKSSKRLGVLFQPVIRWFTGEPWNPLLWLRHFSGAIYGERPGGAKSYNSLACHKMFLCSYDGVFEGDKGYKQCLFSIFNLEFM